MVFFDTSSGKKITEIPDNISYIWTRYSHLPTTLALVGTALTIDTQFTEAVEAGALETFYARTPMPVGVDRSGNPIIRIDFNAVKYWASKFKEIELDAKKWINSLDSTKGEVINYQYAGYFELPKEAKDAYISTTAWSSDQ